MGRSVSYTRIERARIQFPKVRLYVDVPVASTNAARRRGLYDRTFVGPSDGMLFIFDDAHPMMTMTGMRTSLDFVFLNSNHRAVAVYPNVSPGTPSVDAGGSASRYVLEMGPGSLIGSVRIGDLLPIWRYHAPRAQ